MHVKHGYVCMVPMTDTKLCYVVKKALGFDWLKNHTGVTFVMPEQKWCKGSKFMYGFEVFDWTKNIWQTVPIHICDL